MPKKSELTQEQRAEAVMALLRREAPVPQLARRFGVSEQSLYRWRDEFISAGKLGLAGKAPEHEQAREVARLKGEIAKAEGAYGASIRRDLQRAMGDEKKPWEIGKSFDRSAPVGPLQPIRLAASGLEGFVALEVDYGTCGQRAAEVFIPWFKADGELAFKPAGPGDALFDALALQCSFRNLAECPGLAGGQPSASGALEVADFADRHWAAGKVAFLDALARLDREALAEAEGQGLFPYWLDEAARGLAAAPGLSLPERRRRMAWLQARRSPRPAYSDDTVASLVPWLPAEDWAPLVEALRCSRPATLDAALARARELQRTDLERRLQRARAQGCEAPQ